MARLGAAPDPPEASRPDAMQRFLILATKRTGSNHLVALLRSHPDVQCHGEILRRKFDVEKSAPGIDRRFLDPDYRRRHGLAYVDAIEAATRGVSVVGVKLMINHDPSLALTRRLIEERGFKVMLLRRENLLAQYASEKLAEKTGQGTVLKDQAVIRDRVHFDGDRFARFAEGMMRRYETARRALDRIECRYLELEYRELGASALQGRIAHFLGIQGRPLASSHRKRGTQSIVERFDNPEEVRAFLKERFLMEWTEEHTVPGGG
jgi:LPS sulfotransferase NodH